MSYQKGPGQTVVIALGGNALGNTPQEQLELVKNTASHIVDMVGEGVNVVVSHGNGPQVGMIQNAFDYANAHDGKTPAMPLPECGAMSQGYIGYQLSQAILNELKRRDIMRYRTTKSEIEKTRLRRHEPLFLITLVLTMCIILEDTFMMLVWDPTSVSMLPLYISERNFSENFLMLAFAFFSLREAGATLRLRFKEPPASENPEVRRQIDDLLPAYCERHGMTAREREILALVLQGKDNQNIASELQLALGTVKAHVHNILKKTDHASRQDLTRDFWKE